MIYIIHTYSLSTILCINVNRLKIYVVIFVIYINKKNIFHTNIFHPFG